MATVGRSTIITSDQRVVVIFRLVFDFIPISEVLGLEDCVGEVSI